MRHRQIEEVSPAALEKGLAATPLDHYVIWTGDDACGQAGSLSQKAFACIREAGVPVSLRTLIQRAARLEGDRGLDPLAVRDSVRRHQAAKPAVLLLVERRRSGEFIAITDIPHAGVIHRRVCAGDVLLDKEGVLQLGRLHGVGLGRRAYGPVVDRQTSGSAWATDIPYRRRA